MCRGVIDGPRSLARAWRSDYHAKRLVHCELPGRHAMELGCKLPTLPVLRAQAASLLSSIGSCLKDML
eukprot:3566934-Amphidinium_carterae.2